jgi:hypothetical protein
MAKRNAEDAGLEDELINTKKARLEEPTTSFANLFSCLPWEIKRLIFARLKRRDYGWYEITKINQLFIYLISIFLRQPCEDINSYERHSLA